jgi:2'-5' RNA ligase
MQLGGVGAFPTLRRPRVLWIGVDAAGALVALQADVERSLEPLGFRPETRAYSPHLTVGRVERDARAAAFAGLETVARTIAYRSTVAIETVDLMRSHLSRAGARYERVAALPLERKESGRES